MKKRNILFNAVVCLLMLLCVTGCTKKTVITTDDFKAKAEARNYTVTDISERYADYNYFKKAMIAQGDNGLEVEFYVLDTDTNAVSIFATNKATFEGYKSGTNTQSSIDGRNYSTYSLTSGGYYMYLCRVDNTVLYVRVSDSLKDSVKDFVKELGY